MLPFAISYRHLSPLVSLDHTSLVGVENGVKQGPRRAKKPPHVLDPHRVDDADDLSSHREHRQPTIDANNAQAMQ
jgi:hypothetical protein